MIIFDILSNLKKNLPCDNFQSNSQFTIFMPDEKQRGLQISHIISKHLLETIIPFYRFLSKRFFEQKLRYLVRKSFYRFHQLIKTIERKALEEIKNF